MYYLNILYCNVLSEDSCPASAPYLYILYATLRAVEVRECYTRVALALALALLYVVVRQPLKSSVTWIFPKSRCQKSHILNCTIISSTVKYRGYSILST